MLHNALCCHNRTSSTIGRLLSSQNFSQHLELMTVKVVSILAY